jgi:DNA anti-recombination protein RmuC
VIRQATDNFRLERASREILGILTQFRKQWIAYVKTMDKMGERLEQATDQYNDLVGTRTRQLERQLDKIRELEAAPEIRNAEKDNLIPKITPTEEPNPSEPHA